MTLIKGFFKDNIIEGIAKLKTAEYTYKGEFYNNLPHG